MLCAAYCLPEVEVVIWHVVSVGSSYVIEGYGKFI